MFKGREYTYKEAGIELLNRIALELEEEANIEQEAKIEGRNVTMVVVPK